MLWGYVCGYFFFSELLCDYITNKNTIHSTNSMGEGIHLFYKYKDVAKPEPSSCEFSALSDLITPLNTQPNLTNPKNTSFHQQI